MWRLPVWTYNCSIMARDTVVLSYSYDNMILGVVELNYINRNTALCSETTLTGETWLHCEFVHPRDANR